MGTLFVIVFWNSLATPVSVRDSGALKGSPPDVLSYINPFIAQADIAPAEVLCATDSTLNAYCKFRSTFVLPNTGPVFGLDDDSGGGSTEPGVAPANVIAPAILPAKGGPVVVAIDGTVPSDILPPQGDVPAFGSTSESIWEKTVIAWSFLALVFLLLSVQFVSPTRRWRLRRGPSPVPSPEAD